MGRGQESAEFRHDAAEQLGVLLVNLGTPAAATPAAVRRYLAEFLGDRRVIDSPRLLRWLLLHGVILRVRPRATARAYRAIWWQEGSPLLVLTRRLARALEAELATRLPGRLGVVVAMRYGAPAIGEGLRELRSRGAHRLLVLPLYPQYSATTTATAFDAVAAELATWRRLPELRFLTQYHDEPLYIGALARRIEDHWRVQGRGERLLISFHGLPQRHLHQGDPYHCHCQKTARLLAERLELRAGDWAIAFQSRVGREQWLEPYTDVLLRDWARAGLRQVDVVCPGFAVDCLETLEEIALRDRELFLAEGGERLAYVAALNDDPSHVGLLAALVERHCAGWPEAGTLRDEAAEETERARRLERARALGAQR